MITDTQILMYALLASNILLAGAAIIAILRVQRISAYQSADSIKEYIAEGEIKTVKMLHAIDSRLKLVNEKIAGLSVEPSVEAGVERSLPIDNAVRMARNGASVSELVKNCGLSESEARLICQVHGPLPSEQSIH